MFTQARIKLTLYYLLIIMFISLLFSALVYRGFLFEIRRSIRLQGMNSPQEVRVLRKSSNPDVFINAPFFYGIIFGPPKIEPEETEVFEQARNRILWNLAYINLTILITSGVGGYILAGLTLRPIEDMMDEQKEFVSNASHELRTPLTALKTEIEVSLRDKKLTLSDAKTMLKSNLEEVDKMQKLSNYLLVLNKFQNNSKIQLEKVNLKDAAKLAITKVSLSAKAKKIKITQNLKDVHVKGNSMSIAEIAQIFMDNAIKYSGEKSEVIIATYKKRRSSVLEVKDFGAGIGKDDLPHIFERFYRADASRNKEIEGFGLGLSIAKKIADNLGAKITVKSVIGKGSAFKLAFFG